MNTLLTQSFRAGEILLKNTTSRCTDCGRDCPAEVVKKLGNPDTIHLRRTCPDHGEATFRISSDARFYWLAKGSPENSCCGGSCCSASGDNIGTLGKNAAGRSDGPFESLSTCLALIEIVDSCNLACPGCYADSPVGAMGNSLRAIPIEDIKRRIEGVIARKGVIDILQLSGGEPTLHPQIGEILEWAMGHEKIKYVLLNTNGVRFARDTRFTDEIAKRYKGDKLQLYLQFDGPQEAGQVALRGLDLRAIREQAIKVCGDIKLPITLAMTTNHDTLPYIWDTAAFGLRFPHIRGVSYQPFFQSGRIPPGDAEKRDPINVADVVKGLVEGSKGLLRDEDFTPLPCGDPNCMTIGYLLKLNGEVRSVSEFMDFSKVQGFLKDKVLYNLKDLAQCGCENEPLGELLQGLELDESHTFRLSVKPFMDARSWDKDRTDRCCTHVIKPDGKLASFCQYYSDTAKR